MKKVLITGKDSYIGTSVEKYLNRPEYAGLYLVDTVDMISSDWQKKDFSGYDTIFHVAGIAHADISRITNEQKKLYYRVNRDLAVRTAKKAKREGVRQFIYMSSIIVYGENSSVGKERIITQDTQPSPTSFYGDSKWKAEQKLAPLADEEFHVAILRPPMIYGEGCKGNYQLLEKIAMKSPVFPNYPNRRSMLAVEKLCEYVRQLIENQSSGVFCPQDSEYMKTAELVKKIAEKHGKSIRLVNGFNWLINLMGYVPGRIGGMANKAFGSLIYEKNIDISVSSINDKPI